jgi:hypothetical protein
MKNKKRLHVIAITSALIAAFAMSFLFPTIKRGSPAFAGIADYSVSGYNGAEFLHNATKLSGNSDRPASLTFMHHGLNGSYDSLSGIAKYLAESNDVDIYFARIDKPTYVYYKEGDVSPSDPGDPRFRNLTVYNETLRAVVDHDAEGRVIYNDKIKYNETTWKDKIENGNIQ